MNTENMHKAVLLGLIATWESRAEEEREDRYGDDAAYDQCARDLQDVIDLHYHAGEPA